MTAKQPNSGTGIDLNRVLHGSLDRRRLLAPVRARQKAREVFVDEEKPGKRGVDDGHGDEPGRCDP